MTWNVINNILGKHRDATSVSESFPNKNKTELANDFCNYFKDIGPSLASKIPNGKHQYSYYMDKANTKNLFIAPTDEYEVSKLLTSLKSSKSCGHDNLNGILLKKIKGPIALPLANIINTSISTGTMPDALKIAKVIPIYKSGAQSDLGNYRPISLLPVLSKVFEKVIYKRLYTFLNTNKILYESQYGFRSKHSTVYAVSELIEDILEGHKNNEDTLAVFIDLSKAFDTLNHDILIHKMANYGIRGLALKWFQSYLSERKQYVAIDECVSDTVYVSCGVPQGSILGPLLFIIYTNDIPRCLQYSHPILFADDTTIYLTRKNVTELYQIINNELDSLNEWFKTNRLSLNVKKTNYMLFNSGKNPNDNTLSILLNNSSVEKKHVMKFLGLHIDDKLKWDSHIAKLSSKLVSGLYALRISKNIMTTNTLKTLYHSVFQCHINYGLALWGSASKKYINKIWIQQKKAIRIIAKEKYNAHTNNLFSKFKILKLLDMHNLHLASYMHKMYHSELPNSLNKKLVTNAHIHEYNTRHQLDPRIPKLRQTLASRSLYFQSCEFWHQLHSDFKNIPVHSVFISKLKKHLLYKYLL